MAAPRRHATGPQQGTAPPAGQPPAVAKVIAMLARIDDVLTRIDKNVGALRAEVAALAPAARPSCRGHQPRRTARQCPRPRRRQ